MALDFKDLEGLTGEGIVIAVIDSGIDYKNKAFMGADGRTRIVGIWDQTLKGNPPRGYKNGAYFDREDIQKAIDEDIGNENSLKTADYSGHGTAVAAIAAGNLDGIGVAKRADILVVKLGIPDPDSFPRTSELMLAVDFCVRYGLDNNKPVVINLSFGNTYGSHDGTSLLETYIATASSIGRNTVCVGTGNEGAAAGHTSGIVEPLKWTETELGVSMYETSINLQIWKNYVDIFDIEIVTPTGRRVVLDEMGPSRYGVNETELLVYYGEPSPFSQYQEIYIDFIPRYQYILAGLWIIRLYGRKVSFGQYDMWLPSSANINGSKFTYPTPETTLTIPSTNSGMISVGAYDSFTNKYADFSGRGFDRLDSTIKPDIVAPGVDITTAAVGGGTVTASGTSFATPAVSGYAALMMEWGIILGNDRYMYGEKVKANMIRNARPIPGENVPSKRSGWGRI